MVTLLLISSHQEWQFQTAIAPGILVVKNGNFTWLLTPSRPRMAISH